jgi:hypothetical protein
MATLTRVETGNAGPDIMRDEQGRAYWADGAQITDADCFRVDDCELLRKVLREHGLNVLVERLRPITAWKGDRALYTGKTQVMSGGLFYEIEMIEGHLTGAHRWTQREPKPVRSIPHETPA